LDRAGHDPGELLPGPLRRRSARDGRDTEGTDRLDVRGHRLRPGLEEEAGLVPGVDERPPDPPGLEPRRAERMKARNTIELRASHASLASQPSAIVDLIDEAATSLS